jgi:hypothetical protein
MDVARRSLVVFLTLSSLGAAGCFSSSGDFHPRQGTGGYGGYGYGYGGGGGGGGGGTGGSNGDYTTNCAAGATTSLAVSWTIEDPSFKPTTCLSVSGATMDLDVLNVASNVAYHDTFPCDAMAGTSSTLPPGDYSVAMRLRDASASVVSEAIAPTTYPVQAGCSTDLGLVPFDAALTTPDQFISLSWSIETVAGVRRTCATAHAATVELDAGTNTFRWPCINGEAATTSLAPASYPVTIKLLDATGTVLSVTPSMPVPVMSGQPSPLGNVFFSVN